MADEEKKKTTRRRGPTKAQKEAEARALALEAELEDESRKLKTERSRFREFKKGVGGRVAPLGLGAAARMFIDSFESYVGDKVPDSVKPQVRAIGGAVFGEAANRLIPSKPLAQQAMTVGYGIAGHEVDVADIKNRVTGMMGGGSPPAVPQQQPAMGRVQVPALPPVPRFPVPQFAPMGRYPAAAPRRATYVPVRGR